MFSGHRIVCHETATEDDVHRAHVVVAAFQNAKNMDDGWDFQRAVLDRLKLGASVLLGKVLVHVDDEYGARTRRSLAQWRSYCAMYVGWRHVFRNYWSDGWSAMVGRNHAMNCTALLPSCATAGVGMAATIVTGRGSRPRHYAYSGVGSTGSWTSPRVEWTPLGWSSNWQPAVRPLRPASERGVTVGFYGNEKFKLRPNRAALMGRFERDAGVAVDGRMLGKVGFGRGNASDYVRRMHDTRLCLQISGLSAECYRMYEALDAGCVPVLINTFAQTGSPTAAVQYQFLGSSAGRRAAAPFPWADTPAELRSQLAAVRADVRALDALQRATTLWWNVTLEHLRSRVVGSAWNAHVTSC